MGVSIFTMDIQGVPFWNFRSTSIWLFWTTLYPSKGLLGNVLGHLDNLDSYGLLDRFIQFCLFGWTVIVTWICESEISEFSETIATMLPQKSSPAWTMIWELCVEPLQQHLNSVGVYIWMCVLDYCIQRVILLTAKNCDPQICHLQKFTHTN